MTPVHPERPEALTKGSPGGRCPCSLEKNPAGTDRVAQPAGHEPNRGAA